MSYTHLSIIERGQLKTLHQLGYTTRRIAQLLGRHHSTIAREIKLGTTEQTYKAQSAQEFYDQRRALSRPKGKYTRKLAEEVNEKLYQTGSPEQIAERRRIEEKPFICFKTIYRWIDAGRLVAGAVRVLRHQGKQRKPFETRGRFLVGKPISQRPKEIRKRKPFGHWE